MNEETKLILENQMVIMNAQTNMMLTSFKGINLPKETDLTIKANFEQIKKTIQLLNPKEEQSLPSKTADALRGKRE